MWDGTRRGWMITLTTHLIIIPLINMIISYNYQINAGALIMFKKIHS